MFRLARRMPEFGVPSRPVGLAALYDAPDDWVPIYDKSSLGGFYMACGTSGNQFKNAPPPASSSGRSSTPTSEGSTTTSSPYSSSAAARVERSTSVRSHDVGTGRSRPAR